jgi:16S rRNA processing protein RimM
MTFKYLRIGKIINTQGIRGEIKVIPLTDDPGRFSELSHVLIDDEKLIQEDIEYVKYYKNFVLLKFKGLDSINDVEKYKNTYILVDRENAVTLPAGSYFICDLIGLEVVDENGKPLGHVEDVISTGSNDVYVVKQGEKEMLIPALKTVVKEIDIREGKIKVEIPEGLTDL